MYYYLAMALAGLNVCSRIKEWLWVRMSGSLIKFQAAAATGFGSCDKEATFSPSKIFKDTLTFISKGTPETSDAPERRPFSVRQEILPDEFPNISSLRIHATL